MTETEYPFYFAVPRNASRASRQRVPLHLEKKFGVIGPIEHVRSDDRLHLYRVIEVAS